MKNFYGMKDEYIVSGSDCGRIFFWEKKSGRLLGAIVGDTRVVNCVQRRSQDLLLATSGIDHDIKLFSPTADEATMRCFHLGHGSSRSRIPDMGMHSEIEDIVRENERILESSRAENTMRIPPAMVLRMIMMMRAQAQESDQETSSSSEADLEDSDNEN